MITVSFSKMGLSATPTTPTILQAASGYASAEARHTAKEHRRDDVEKVLTLTAFQGAPCSPSHLTVPKAAMMQVVD